MKCFKNNFLDYIFAFFILKASGAFLPRNAARVTIGTRLFIRFYEKNIVIEHTYVRRTQSGEERKS